MKRRCIFWIVIILSVGLISCKNSKKTAAEKLVTEWLGKEIRFPTSLKRTYMGKDTVVSPEAKNMDYKILLYTDSNGCTSCKLNLSMWKVYMKEIDSVMPNRIEFLFYFQPKNTKELSHLLKRDRLETPVFIDDKGEISRINNFPKKMEYQCFLLDHDNKVLSIGNPAINPKIWEVYKRIFNSATK